MVSEPHSISIMNNFLGLSVATALSFACGLNAQTLYVYDGNAAVVRELTGPSDPSFCSYPDGPVFSAFPTQADFLCTMPGTIIDPLHGDIAVNRGDDRIWVTDGRVFGEGRSKLFASRGPIFNSSIE